MADRAPTFPGYEALAHVFDELLAQRRADARDRKQDRGWARHEELPGWSSRDLLLALYRRHADLLHRKAPLKSMVMEIADYFECTVDERNRLLNAVNYSSLPIYLSNDALQPTLAFARQVAQTLLEPTYIVNRDWDILYVNDQLLRLIELTEDEYQRIPPALRNILQLIFDPQLPVRAKLEAVPGNWEYVAKSNVFSFKIINVFYRFEKWYQERLDRWMKLPTFEEQWKAIDIGPLASTDDLPTPFQCYTIRLRTSQGVVRVRLKLTRLGNRDFPQIISYEPVDAASSTIFQQLGVPQELSKAPSS